MRDLEYHYDYTCDSDLARAACGKKGVIVLDYKPSWREEFHCDKCESRVYLGDETVYQVFSKRWRQEVTV
jgi:hypothetical protein